MDVLIIETKTGKLVTTVPIKFGGLNYSPSEQEYFSEAWRCAVEDKAVDPARRDEYNFRLLRSAWEER